MPSDFFTQVRTGKTLTRELLISSPPHVVFDSIHSKPFSFFLDSGMDTQNLGRYSFMGYNPFLIMKSKGKKAEITFGGETYIREGNPFRILDNIIQHYKLSSDSSLPPFLGGGVGYFSYDLCHFIEELPKTVTDDLNLPDLYFCFYDFGLAYDHQKGKWYLFANDLCSEGDSKSGKSMTGRIMEMEEEILALLNSSVEIPASHYNSTHFEPTVRSNFTREGYLRAIEKAKEYIFAGDIYQVNLSQRFHTSFPVQPFALYKKLRSINPAPFACYLNFDEVAVVSSSPERFLKVDGDRVQTRPIKGTRPRGKNHGEDRELKEQLLKSEKDRAELNMIVDLERNDLGRVCDYGSVIVKEHAVVETYATVFHLVSTIEGRLLHRNSCIDLLKACFPGGSITGAPKIRAMEIIDELEPTARNVYTGSIGYLGFNGHVDLNIAIRTFLIKGNDIYFQVGGGVVADSTLEGEYEETLDKAKALFQSLFL